MFDLMDKPVSHKKIIPQGTQSPILFFDGDCGFCNASVRFVLRHEKDPVLLFAQLQGSTADEMLSKSPFQPDVGAGGTIILADGKEFLIRSRAAFRTMDYMGGGWKALSSLLQLFPVPLADSVYRLIARLRGYLPSCDSCALMPPEQRRRFLP